MYIYTSPSFGDAYNYLQLTPNFVFWPDFFFFFCVDMFPFDDSEILSVCPYPDKRNNSTFVNICLTVVIDRSIERSSLGL